MKKFLKIILTFLFFFYLSVLTYRILFKYVSTSEIISHFNFTYHETHIHSDNFIPFKTIIYYLFLADINLNIRIMNLVGNIIGFVPFGFILPVLIKKFRNLKNVVIATFILSITYEIIQLVFDFGSFDIDDLILNTIGGILGYFPIKFILFFIISRKKNLENSVPIH